MSHSTEIRVEIGLDKFEIHCGSRTPAECNAVAPTESRTFVDVKALDMLKHLPNQGAGRHALFGVLVSMAADQCQMYENETGWLKLEITHCV